MRRLNARGARFGTLLALPFPSQRGLVIGVGMAEGAPYWMLWDELVVGGAHWSGLLRRGTTLRLTDVAGGGNVSALFYNYEDRLERYNMADTLKAQHTAYLTRGCVCYSDMGRALCSITDDTFGLHDALCFLGYASFVSSQYGDP